MADGAPDLVVSLRPKLWAIAALWAVAMFGFGGAVAGAVGLHDWSGLVLVGFGFGWAAIFVALTRPFVEARVEGLAYRRYLTNPQQSRVEGSPPDSRKIRVRSGLNAAKGEVWALVNLVVVVVLLLFGPRPWRRELVGLLLVWTATWFSSSARAPAVNAVEVDTMGLHLTTGGLRRRVTHHAPGSVDRVVAVPGHRHMDLAVLFRDHSVLIVPVRVGAGDVDDSVESTAASMEAVLHRAMSPRFQPR